MQIKALVRVINAPESGVSKTSGNPWVRQDIIIGWDELREDGRTRQQLLKVTLHGESVERFAALRPVAGVTVIEGELVFSTSPYGGKVYNDVTLFL